MGAGVGQVGAPWAEAQVFRVGVTCAQSCGFYLRSRGKAFEKLGWLLRKHVFQSQRGHGGARSAMLSDCITSLSPCPLHVSFARMYVFA